MYVYIGFDDTDNLNADRGTGKLARWFEDELPKDCRLEGVVRQQLLIHERIPYTSHNSSACVIVHAPDASLAELLTAKAISHIERYSLEGSDPGTASRPRSIMLCPPIFRIFMSGCIRKYSLDSVLFRNSLLTRDSPIRGVSIWSLPFSPFSLISFVIFQTLFHRFSAGATI
jgi:hypothetical protein